MPRTAVPFFTNTVTASPAGATETVIATLSGCTVSYSSDRFILVGWADITLQAAVTSVTLRIRRTSVSGTAVATAIATPKAAADWTRMTFSIDGSDAPGDVAGAVYVLTAELTAAAGASTVNAVGLIASCTS